MKIPFLKIFASKKQEEKKSTLVSFLAPKVLTKKEDIEKIQPYLDRLNEAIDTKDVNNIALMGGYGSGKSTIIKTFQHLNKRYEFLNISLASFNKKGNNKDKSINDSNETIKKDELERLLEVSILQQIFYHVKPSQIPESRFKRIINIPNWKIWAMSISFILWILSLILLLKYDYLDMINPPNWRNGAHFGWFSLLILLTSTTGLGLFAKLIINLFSNSKINKVNIKGELELGDNINKSVFNEHLEEILYFFERTKFDVVIIEDLDRFDSTDIFTKLREINILLNNSLLINREINFVYAVGDDLFKDKKERVKFFEYIIPVIPFINSTNADDQLRVLIRESGLDENIFTREFISDVTTFIDDIDMRLLTNIFHEFEIYRKILKPGLIKKNDELFAMVTYKNIDPKDYTNLTRKQGKLYDFINNKETYIKESIDKIDSEIAKKSAVIKEHDSQTINDLEELKSIYLQKILSKLPKKALISTEIIGTNFEELIKEQRVVYKYENFSRLSSEYFNFNFTEIENDLNSHYTYEDRVEIIKAKESNIVEILKGEIEKLRKKRIEIENSDLKHIFNEIDVDQYLDNFSNNKLLRNLILNGYINENYNDYISLFHGISITANDFAFERNVRSGHSTAFNYELDKIENLVDRIGQRYFEREAILNFHMVDYLGKNYDKHPKKYNSVINLLSNEKKKSTQFIDEYLENERPSVSFPEKKTVR